MAVTEDQRVAQLLKLAEDRARRMQPNGRPVFKLTEAEADRSALTAMRLADAAPDQVAARLKQRSADR